MLARHPLEMFALFRFGRIGKAESKPFRAKSKRIKLIDDVGHKIGFWFSGARR